MNFEKDICQICGEGNLTYHTEKIQAEHNGVTGEIDSHYALCSSCGIQGGPEEMRKNKRMMIAFKKKACGLLTGSQVRQIRSQLGINQKEAAKIFGGGPVAFCKYENNDITQSEAMDKLIRLVGSKPELLYTLGRSAQPKPIARWQAIHVNLGAIQKPRANPVRASRKIERKSPWRKVQKT